MCVMSPCVDIEEPSRELCRSARAAPTSSCSTGRGPGPLPSTQSFCGKPDWSCTWNCGHEQLFNTWYLTGHQFRSRYFMGTCQVQNLVLKCLPTLQTCNLRWRFPTFILQLVNVLETQPFFFLQILPPKTQSLFQEILSLALSMHPWYLHSPESPHMLCPHVSQAFSDVALHQFQRWSDLQWPFLILSRKIQADHWLLPLLSSSAHMWCPSPPPNSNFMTRSPTADLLRTDYLTISWTLHIMRTKP